MNHLGSDYKTHWTNTTLTGEGDAPSNDRYPFLVRVDGEDIKFDEFSSPTDTENFDAISTSSADAVIRTPLLPSAFDGDADDTK